MKNQTILMCSDCFKQDRVFNYNSRVYNIHPFLTFEEVCLQATNMPMLLRIGIAKS